MKRIIPLLLMLVLLTGCGFGDIFSGLKPTKPETPEVTTESAESDEPTEPPLPWTEAVGMPWDRDGVLLEMPLSIPDGLHYSYFLEVDGDLLLWSMDTHLENCAYLEMCLIELDDSTISALRDLEVSEYVTPQVLDGYIYVCDHSAGRIEKLNKSLQTVEQWTTEAEYGTWYMGADETLYTLNLDLQLHRHDLKTGASVPALEGDPAVAWLNISGETAVIEYYRDDTGAKTFAVLDLMSGEVQSCRFDDYDTVYVVDNNWLCENYDYGYTYYLSVNGAEPVCIDCADSNFRLQDEGWLLETTFDNRYLRLYTLDGELISSACAYEVDSGYFDTELIWNESLGGYFLQARGYDETKRLLFWDISKSSSGENLEFTAIPEPDANQSRLEEEAEKLEQKYGVSILVGDECETSFYEFTASQVTDWNRVNAALDTLDRALVVYPAGFLKQLRYGSIHGIQIQLISDLWADGSGRYGDGYIAFTQPYGDHYLMVIDIDDVTVETYYHEFSHIIDSYLEWDALEREDALYSEERWAAFNPGWFTGYSYDYSVEHYLEDYSFFVDGYSTISPTEDRARVMEYAMAEYGYWTFEGSRGLLNKLEYYAKCIRDAFDTTGWPETVLWEQYL